MGRGKKGEFTKALLKTPPQAGVCSLMSEAGLLTSLTLISLQWDLVGVGLSYTGLT